MPQISFNTVNLQFSCTLYNISHSQGESASFLDGFCDGGDAVLCLL